jgi:hypothetical protein
MTFLTLLLLRWLRRRAIWAEVRFEHGVMTFSADDVKSIYGFGCVLAAGFAFAMAAFGARWSLLPPVAIAVVFLYCWPADILITPGYVIDRRWWGKRTRIAWENVVSVVHRTGDHSTFVFAGDGREIHHTGFHASPARFQAEIKLRTPVTRIADWDAVPSLVAAR